MSSLRALRARVRCMHRAPSAGVGAHNYEDQSTVKRARLVYLSARASAPSHQPRVEYEKDAAASKWRVCARRARANYFRYLYNATSRKCVIYEAATLADAGQMRRSARGAAHAAPDAKINIKLAICCRHRSHAAQVRYQSVDLA
jgi:hypothetical protein